MSAFSEIDIQLQTDPTLCEDCCRVLTPANVSVDPQAAFWAKATWDQETRCAPCKENFLPGSYE